MAMSDDEPESELRARLASLTNALPTGMLSWCKTRAGYKLAPNQCKAREGKLGANPTGLPGLRDPAWSRASFRSVGQRQLGEVC